ncbi:hypothetical protein GCM10019059_35580 [Camelimonas fluminis]|uniref:Uncharacterized protein n=1 Tax=Camelimonas fluminis TaxID=1576911 RepID=A0ABV7UFL1_9HYPH|nr:hypothetical protein [Camelimonas fluminis]GHE72873.1 hypothetical protein GCM10019059_35580 [Camelimonas fluminis]
MPAALTNSPERQTPIPSPPANPSAERLKHLEAFVAVVAAIEADGDLFTAQTPSGASLRARYADLDELQEDIGESRLFRSHMDLQNLIGCARLLAGNHTTAC